VDENDFTSVLKQEIVNGAGVEKDGRSWIAAKIQVRHSVAVQ
jgi:hypothetical protein